MRVLLVANTLPPADISGVGEQVLQLAAGLREAGHEVEVLGRGAGGAGGPKLLFPLMVVPPFVRRLRAFRPHVVQVHESDGGLAALVCAVVAPLLEPRPLLAALLQVSYVEEVKAVRPLLEGTRVIGRPGARERRFRWLKAPVQVVLGCLSAWVADVVLAPSRRTGREIEHDYGVTGVGWLPNVTGGLDAPIAPPIELAGSGYLLFVGRLRIRKGVEVLLESLARIAGERPHARLLIAGDGEHLHALERATERLGLSSKVEFLGRTAAAGVRQLLAGAAALVVPSIYEGMPLVILEAMEAGIPVIASSVSGIPEVVVDGETGWLVPCENTVALADALAAALDDAQEAARRGAAGRRRLDECFRPEHAVATWQKLFVHEGNGMERERRP